MVLCAISIVLASGDERKAHNWRKTNNMNKSNKNTIFSIIVLLITSVIIMARQILSQGYFSTNMNDTFAYTSWAWQFTEQMKEGVIYPRWMSLDFYGYGAPVFILYPPLAFYLTAFVNIFTDSIVTAMNYSKLAALFLSSVGIFLYAKEILREKYALIAAISYLMMPFTVMQFYLLGAFASTISFSWFPYILLYTHRYIKDGEISNIIYLIICYSGLICTHLINAYMFTYVFILYLVVLAIINKQIGKTKIIPVVIITAMLLSSAFTLPLLFEKQHVNLNTFIKNNNYNYGEYTNFFILPDMTRNLPLDHSWVIYHTTYVLVTMLFCTLIVFVLLNVLKKDNYKKNKEVFFIGVEFTGVAIISILLLFGPSKMFWQVLPFFKYIQFPARWMNITNFVCAILIAILLYYLPLKKRLIYIFILSISFVLLDYKYMIIANVFEGQALFPVKEVNWTIEHLPSGISLDEIANSNIQTKKVELKNGSGKLRIVDWKPTERIISIKGGQPSTIKVATFNFPGWTADIDGRITQIKTEKNTSAIIIDIPAGEHLLKLVFKDTPIRMYGKIISFSTLMLALLFLIFQKFVFRKQKVKQ